MRSWSEQHRDKHPPPSAEENNGRAREGGKQAFRQRRVQGCCFVCADNQPSHTCFSKCDEERNTKPPTMPVMSAIGGVMICVRHNNTTVSATTQGRERGGAGEEGPAPSSLLFLFGCHHGTDKKLTEEWVGGGTGNSAEQEVAEERWLLTSQPAVMLTRPPSTPACVCSKLALCVGYWSECTGGHAARKAAAGWRGGVGGWRLERVLSHRSALAPHAYASCPASEARRSQFTGRQTPCE